ncbi:MAG: S1C family serine protease [Armatimonadota bacterium]
MRVILALACLALMTLSAQAQGVLESLEREITALARKVQAGVVSVEGGVLIPSTPPPSMRVVPPQSEPARRWLEAMRLLNLPSPISRKGSGFVIDRDGWILTSADIVRGAETCTVRFADGRRVKAQVVSVDDVTNLALVKCPDSTPQALLLGDSDKVDVGALVLCVGTIGGYERSVVLGVVAGKERVGVIGQQQFLSNLLQISGSVGAGSSGAPVVNTRGEVVGVVIASIAPGLASAPLDTDPGRTNTTLPNLGSSLEMSLFGSAGGVLAVPINDVRAVLDDMRAGRLRRALLGIVPADHDSEGAEVVRVIPNSPAARAGIRLGDVIVALNKTPVHRAADVSTLLRRMKPGQRVEVEILRGSKRIKMELQLGERGSSRP